MLRPPVPRRELVPRAPLALALALVLPASAAAQEDELPGDAEVRTAWSRLTAAEQRDAAEWFSAEVEYLETAQQAFLRHARSLLEVDPGLLPDAEPAAWFDPAVHAPGQPISRTVLAPDDELTRAAHRRFFAEIPERGLASAWRYDWGSGAIVRTGDPADPELVFANALAGFPPGADLAEAIVLRALDDGSQRAALGALAHAYTDRAGRVYTGITLYDAWASGAEMEMPDVDNLGVVHVVLDEWKKWRAPISSTTKQRKLYDAVGEIFAEAHRHRGLREALARTYASGSPVLDHGYDGALDALHGLWEEAGGDPLELAGDLPAPKRWESFLKRAQKDVGKRKAGEAARGRHETLDGDAWWVRAEMIRVLRELGAFERARAPDPPDPPGPSGEGTESGQNPTPVGERRLGRTLGHGRR